MTIFSALAAVGMFSVGLIGALFASPRIYDYPWTDQRSDVWVSRLIDFYCKIFVLIPKHKRIEGRRPLTPYLLTFHFSKTDQMLR